MLRICHSGRRTMRCGRICACWCWMIGIRKTPTTLQVTIGCSLFCDPHHNLWTWTRIKMGRRSPELRRSNAIKNLCASNECILHLNYIYVELIAAPLVHSTQYNNLNRTIVRVCSIFCASMEKCVLLLMLFDVCFSFLHRCVRICWT